MKLLLSTGVYPPEIGGPSTQSRHLATALAGRGIDVTVLTWGATAGEAERDGVRVLTLDRHDEPVIGPTLQYAGATSRISHLLRREKPDLVHHVSGCDYLCILLGALCRAHRIPGLAKYAGDLVWETTVGGGGRPESYEAVFRTPRGRFLRRVERFAFESYDRVWATSEFQHDSLVRLVGVAPERIVRMPNFVEVPERSRPARPAGDPFVILAASRLAPWKRVEDVVTAVARLSRPDVLLRVVGGGHEGLARGLRELATSLGIGDRVTFTGPVPPSEMEREFAGADLFVSAAEYEPFGIVLVEAMSWGIPIVAAAVGGVPEVVPDGEAGVLVQPREVDGLAAGIGELIDRPDRREAMGLRGMQVARGFDLERNLDRVTDVYESILSGSPGSSSASFAAGGAR